MNDLSFPEQYRAQPYKQGLLILAACLLIMGVAKLTNHTGEIQWTIAVIGILFFSWVNPFLNIFHKKWLVYVAQSTLVFIVLILCLLFTAKFLSIDKLADHKEYRIMIPLAIVFFVLTNMVSRIIKFIYTLTHEKL